MQIKKAEKPTLIPRQVSFYNEELEDLDVWLVRHHLNFSEAARALFRLAMEGKVDPKEIETRTHPEHARGRRS